MKVLLSWLKDYIDIQESPEKIAEALNMTGLEVEEVIQPGKNLDQIVVGKILSRDPHPDADKLSLCSVDVNRGQPLQIVCGANNMKAGDKVPVAMLGAKLPGGFEISRAKIRGVESSGMMCSKKELGLSEDHGGLYILDESAHIGEDIVKALSLDEVIFDISITPNRGDALSHLGIARELSAIFNLPLHRDPLSNEDGEDSIENHINVEIEDTSHCPRYGARVVHNIKVGPSPEWLKDRLEKAGLRSINNVVDVTNYIMLDIGHPMHAFDLSKVEGNKIVVRNARKDEKIMTLDNIEHGLDSSMLVIADANKPLALAGVMGGLNSSVSENTCSVLLEAAFFNPTTIRKTAKRLGMMSDSSYRFERGTNIDNVPIALNQAARLLKEIAGGKPVKGLADCYPKPEILRQIRVRTKRANRVIGINLTPAQIETFLLRLKLDTRRDGEDLIVSVPPYRHDLELEVDIIEEIARMYGYNNIPETLPAITSVLQLPTALQKICTRLRDHMVSCGFNEIMTYSFIPENVSDSFREKKPMMLKNPLSEDLSAMRTSLKWGMYDALRRNILNDEFNLKLFEIGRVFHPSAGGLSEEHTRLCLGFSGSQNPRDWRRNGENFDLYVIKGVVENIAKLLRVKVKFTTGSCSLFHPAMQMELIVGKNHLGEIGQLHPEFIDNKKMPKCIYLVEIDLGKAAEASEGASRMQPIPDLPAIRRDLALVAPESIGNREINKILTAEGKALLEDCYLFDVYQGKGIEPGYRSLAYSLTFRDLRKTLTDEEIQPLIDKMIGRLDRELSVKLR
ncbi:MAG: phenylalanine--tRNA ligase subunit beta [Candidatus Riflebacteria bacterium HGW-Riflebacteria-1]|nr:MAG: phenylalanine--tRNA ligase subunit beta [Candidatus Riflebacteria bacterium HGW-Riflebacteria-1]